MIPAVPPERIADERTPIADAVWIAVTARRIVRTGLRYCRTCQAAASLPCRTVSGATARRAHRGRGVA